MSRPHAGLRVVLVAMFNRRYHRTGFALQAAPVDGSVTVSVNGDRETAFSVDKEGPALVFDSAPAPEAVIEVRYQLAGGG